MLIAVARSPRINAATLRVTPHPGQRIPSPLCTTQKLTGALNHLRATSDTPKIAAKATGAIAEVYGTDRFTVADERWTVDAEGRSLTPDKDTVRAALLALGGRS